MQPFATQADDLFFNQDAFPIADQKMDTLRFADQPPPPPLPGAQANAE